MNELEKHITLKGTSDGYYLLLNEESSFTEIHEGLEELLEHLKKDYKKGSIFRIDD